MFAASEGLEELRESGGESSRFRAERDLITTSMVKHDCFIICTNKIKVAFHL